MTSFKALNQTYSLLEVPINSDFDYFMNTVENFLQTFSILFHDQKRNQIQTHKI